MHGSLLFTMSHDDVSAEHTYPPIQTHLSGQNSAQQLSVKQSPENEWDHFRKLSQFHIGRFPSRFSTIGIGKIGFETYSAFVCFLCLSLCVVQGQSDHTNRFHSTVAHDCPHQCRCTTISKSGNPGVNVSCVAADLRRIPKFANMDPEISVLNLSGNLIKDILSHSFENMKFLKVLNLAHNHIAFINATMFRGLSDLTHIYLDHNVLSSLHPDIFSDTHKLHHLDISHNMLTTIPSGLFHIEDSATAGSSITTPANYHDLLYLDIGNNRDLGKDLSSDRFPFTRLQYFGLSGIGLSNPDVVVEFLSRTTTEKLRELDLSNNQFTVLFAQHMEVFKEKAQILNLSGNPLRCDCAILSFVHWLQANVTSAIKEWILPTCQYPDNLRNRSVLTLTSAQVKVNCDLTTKCRNKEHFLSDSTFDPDECNPVSHVFLDDMAQTTTPVGTTVYVPYDHIRSSYDPMLGWYTAMVLGGMVFLLIACLVIERAKKKYESYRHRLWRRKIRKAILAARATEEACSQDDPDLMSPLQSLDTSTYSYTNEVNASDIKDSTDNTSRSCSGMRQHSVTSSDTCNNVIPSSRRVSVSWGPTCEISKPDHSASRLAIHSSSLAQPMITRSESLAQPSSVAPKPSIERCSSTTTERKPPQTLPITPNRPAVSRSNSSVSPIPSISRQSSTTSGGPVVSRQSSAASARPSIHRQSSTPSGKPTVHRQSSTTSGKPTVHRQSSTTSGKPTVHRQSSTTSGKPTVHRQSSTASGKPTVTRQSSTTYGRPAVHRQSSTTSGRSAVSRQSSTTSQIPATSSNSPVSSRNPRSIGSSSASQRPHVLRHTDSTASHNPAVTRSDSVTTDRLTAPGSHTNTRGRPGMSRSSSNASSRAAFSRSNSSATGSDMSTSLSPGPARMATGRPNATARRASFAQTRSNSRARSVSPKPTRMVTPIVTVDGEEPKPLSVHRGGSIDRVNTSNTVQSLWNTLEHVIRDIKVAQVNPECPLHNRKAYQRLKAIIRQNPDTSLEKLLEQHTNPKS